MLFTYWREKFSVVNCIASRPFLLQIERESRESKKKEEAEFSQVADCADDKVII